jgi:pimeloyl-ACP methyl ester carboxylesterase
MTPRRRLGRRLFKSLLPIIVLLAVALIIAFSAIVYGITRPCRRAYLVTPQSFTGLSGRVLKVTDETWTNSDGTRARGWLLKGAEGAPAVIFLHKYCADRSWLFNLGVKVNETTNYTILWPDARGHGMEPLTTSTTFGNREADDVLSAMAFLRSLKGDGQPQLIGEQVGVYGVEMGAYAALRAATREPKIKALVLDSVPRDPDDLVNSAVREDVGIDTNLLLKPARIATHTYFLGAFENLSSCDLASKLRTQRILLLAGTDAEHLRQSTVQLQMCFITAGNLEVKTDLPLTGFTLASATGEQGERYDRPVIDFFQKSLQ